MYGPQVTAFSMTEFDLRGLLPPTVMSNEQQIERDILEEASYILNDPFMVLIANIEEYAAINYGGLFRRPRGMYFSAADWEEMMSVVYNWPAELVDMIVVTDGRRILGLGDLGVQGLGITIGKLDLFVAAAGINPQRILSPSESTVLPVMIDVGTKNERLLKSLTLNSLLTAECTPREAYSIVGDHIIFASGSPFIDVDLGNGLIGHCNQGNNMYVYPGLAEYMTDEEVLKGKIYPSISRKMALFTYSSVLFFGHGAKNEAQD
ncbi:Malic enzyme, NAD-binding [Dillenia turbinata]|uniref:Malic enzyme, NAD-binding n=1 Tax=Dillenia turbinata TaxID=194707 RepID=A0AAN8W012_9MAGN